MLKGEYGRSVEVTIEGSARRGSTFSAKAEQALNPHSDEINGFLKDIRRNQRQIPLQHRTEKGALEREVRAVATRINSASSNARGVPTRREPLKRGYVMNCDMPAVT